MFPPNTKGLMLKRAREASFINLLMLGKQPCLAGRVWRKWYRSAGLLSADAIDRVAPPQLLLAETLRPVFSHCRCLPLPPLVAPGQVRGTRCLVSTVGRRPQLKNFCTGHHGLKLEQLPGALDTLGYQQPGKLRH